MTIRKNSNKWLRFLKRIILGLAVFIAFIGLYIMMHPQFGKRPSGERLQRIQLSKQFKNGKFRNTSPTPMLSQPWTVALYDYLFKRSKETSPQYNIPTVHVDWKKLLEQSNGLVWFGHSSYLLHVDGKNILVDPVFSGSASPIPGSVKAFKGTDVSTVSDLPAIDFLFISHDHYDHMDYKTLKALQPRVGKVIVGLGVGAHLEYWGYRPEQIIERDWWDEVDLGDGFQVTVAPARHFSGRGIFTANTLWASYALQTPTKKLYLGGDSGYDSHFKEIGNQLGPFDLAILENGQYDLSWKHIHMMPEEVVQAAHDLKASVLFPVHSAKFVLANHAWYEPLERISIEATKQQLSLLTPMIGQVISIDQAQAGPSYWWKK
ncbi:L-ascorbate metabolism protein UlaG (beta-lactamase superfamily) [Sphingobacterium zeae]|uniref:L-ascorbate metabolism protein UlaG (Beta-lactamase superfamily) n=1 Tax=Sphingobacterium zeae TaxID=1776859 RepID=A0ABU0UA80_9SPHI|nr:MBL fold metallo-hydrolase [Sphingobacterium zeae]MDQ1151757.1 L-ascorbate metabolism protein UlaG (beta-lactamase superfamily) [Sphingobacterium zeae]